MDSQCTEADVTWPVGRADAARRQWLLSPGFRLVWWGQTVSQVGDGISKLALIWFVYAVTGSPLKATVIGLLQTIPPILLGPLIGVAIDRLPKKPLLIGSDVIRAFVIGFIPCWMSVESFTVDRLYLLVLLNSVATAVFGPALTAAIPAIVARPQYTAANALLQSTTSLGVIVGPAISGLGIAALSSQDVLCLNALTYMVSAACFVPLKLAPTETVEQTGGAVSSTLHDLREVIHFSIVRQPTILTLTIMASLYTFGSSAFSTLFPVFARKLLDLGPVEVGYLWSAFGVGLMAVSIGLIWISEWNLMRRIQVILFATTVSGWAMLGLVWVSDRYLAGALMVLIGGGLGALTPIAWGVLQELVPPQMVGRALALYSTGAMTAAIAGMWFFGWTSERWGEQWSVMGIGVTLFITAIFAASFSRRSYQRTPASS
ncbi:MFS transporter [Nitrospira sp.]|nr:MFS transporter [Nitrospira sp.]